MNEASTGGWRVDYPYMGRLPIYWEVNSADWVSVRLARMLANVSVQSAATALRLPICPPRGRGYQIYGDPRRLTPRILARAEKIPRQRNVKALRIGERQLRRGLQTGLTNIVC